MKGSVESSSSSSPLLSQGVLYWSPDGLKEVKELVMIPQIIRHWQSFGVVVWTTLNHPEVNGVSYLYYICFARLIHNWPIFRPTNRNYKLKFEPPSAHA